MVLFIWLVWLLWVGLSELCPDSLSSFGILLLMTSTISQTKCANRAPVFQFVYSCPFITVSPWGGVIFSNKPYGCQTWFIKRGYSVFVIVCFDNSCVLLTLIFSEAVMWETWIAISHTILNGLKNVNNIYFFKK